MYNILILLAIITGWMKVPINYGIHINNKVRYQSTIFLGFGKNYFPKGLNFYNQLEFNLNKRIFLVFNQRGFYQGFLGGIPSVLGVALGYRIFQGVSTFFEFERGLENAKQIDYGTNIFGGFNLLSRRKYSFSFIVGHGLLSTEEVGKVDPLGIGVHLTYYLLKNLQFSFEYEPVPKSLITLLEYKGRNFHNITIGPSVGVRIIKKDVIGFLAFNINFMNKVQLFPQNNQKIYIEFLTCINGQDTLLIPRDFWSFDKNLKDHVIQLVNPPWKTKELTNFHGLIPQKEFDFNKIYELWCVLKKTNGKLIVILTPKKEIAETFSNKHKIYLTTLEEKKHREFIIKCFIPIKDLYKF